MTIRLVHIISDLHRGGAQSMLSRVVQGLEGDGFQQTVISLTGRGVIGDRLQAAGIEVRYVGMRRGVPNPLGLVRLWWLLRRIQPDIVQTWLYHADLLGTLAAKASGVPVLLWNLRQSSMDVASYSWMSRQVVRSLARLSSVPDAILTNTRTGKEQHAASGYHPAEWVWLPNGFEIDVYRPVASSLRTECNIPADAMVIGMVARYDPMKGYGVFIEAALRLLQQREDVVFVLVGSQVTEANDALMQPIRDAGKAAHFRLLGERDDIPAVMSAFDVYTSASRYGEGFSNSIGEAMACGVPCVVTDVGDSAYIVGETGIVIAPDDPDALLSAWRSLLALARDERQKRGQAARARMVENFALETIIARYRATYERFVHPSR